MKLKPGDALLWALATVMLVFSLSCLFVAFTDPSLTQTQVMLKVLGL